MSMAHAEIDNFVSKFKSLLNAGFQASLKFNALNSEVSVALEASLGSVLDSKYGMNITPPRGPSYFRRQQGRRQEASEKTSRLEVSTNDVNKIAEEVNDVDNEHANEVIKTDSDDGSSC